MSHRTRFGATRDLKRHTLKKKFRRGGRAANQFRRDAWPGLLQEVNDKAHNHLGSRMGRCARIFGPFPRLPLVSCLRLQLSQKRHVKRRVRHTENEFGPYKSPGASLLRYVGRARRQPGRRPPMVPKNSTSAAPQGATAAEDATDAASGTPTRRGQPALARGCSSPRVGARSTPRRPARDRGRASPGHPSAAPHRWRLCYDSPFDSADRRQIVSTARACGPAARSSAGASRADILVLVVTKKSSN